MDVVLDPLGGRDWRKGLGLLRPAGRLVAYGFANLVDGDRRRLTRVAGQAARVPVLTPLGLMSRNQTVAGVNIGHLWGEVPMLREELVELLRLWREGRIRPRLDAVYPFAEAAGAHRRLGGRHNIGKVIMVPWARHPAADPVPPGQPGSGDPAAGPRSPAGPYG